jgi:hypothetical protein
VRSDAREAADGGQRARRNNAGPPKRAHAHEGMPGAVVLLAQFALPEDALRRGAVRYP